MPPSTRPTLTRFAALAAALALLAAPTAFAAVAVTEVARGGTAFQAPLDATPSPDAQEIYFVASRPDGVPAVFQVPAEGGTIRQVLAGAPLAAPRGVVVATDGRTLYVADPAAAGGGAVFAVPTEGGTAPVRALPATVGRAPRALDLVREHDADTLYVAGTDPANGRAQVWRIASAARDGSLEDAAAETVLRGSPLGSADGIAVAADGTLYVAGRNGASDRSETVLRVRAGVATPLVRQVRLGAPAGLALTHDQSRLLVSSLSAAGTSQVVIVELASGTTSVFDDVIRTRRASGGLHRAHAADVFAWADSTVDPADQGTIFRISLGGG